MEILAGFFRDDAGEHYVMLQNVRHSGGSPPNDNDRLGTVRIALDFSTAPPWLDRSRILVLDPERGLVRRLAIERHGASRGIVRFPLEAGDVVLFKYATGTPFVGS
jgi:hypothetical protein